jgi:ubiquinone/menaquinone biosynthesis C-methylase UbiE
MNNYSNYGWMLDEQSHAGNENLDPQHVKQYDLKEDACAIEELKLLETLGLNDQSSVIDFGAGTGQFTIVVAPKCARVIAVDVSPVMLDVLDEKVKNSELSNIEIIRSGFLTYEHIGQPVDFVYSRFALHHLPDFWKVMALKRIRSMIRKGGVFRLWDVVYSFEPKESENRLEAWCATLNDHEENGWTRSDIEEHIRDEHSTYTWLLEPMIQRCGFTIEQTEYSEDSIFAKYVIRAI